MKVIIAGGRDFDDYGLLKHICDHMLQNHKEDLIIVSGCARGADTLGEQYAKDNGYLIKPFKANWDKYGKAAGHIRNSQMAEYADALIAFWDGSSKGTKNMIDQAYKNTLKVHVENY